MAKIVREDYGWKRGRASEWPAYPKDLSLNAPLASSTSIVCAICGSPTGGLRYISETDRFEHRQKCT